MNRLEALRALKLSPDTPAAERTAASESFLSLAIGLFEATGRTNPDEILGVVSAWKFRVENEKTEAEIDKIVNVEGAGKIYPVQRDEYRTMGRTMGVDFLRSMVERLPTYRMTITDGSADAPPDVKEALQQFGLTTEDYRAAEAHDRGQKGRTP